MIPPGSIPSARATSRNSITSSRRSPLSNFETNDCGRPSFFASVTWVSPTFRRASAKRPRKCSCFRVNADFATGAVCYPNIEYPKLGYTIDKRGMARNRAGERVECPLCGGRGTTRGRALGRIGAARYRCELCAGDGSVSRAQIKGLQRLRDQMQRVADAMQAGNADRAARETRLAVRLARPLLS
jgi:hypothetical protein